MFNSSTKNILPTKSREIFISTFLFLLFFFFLFSLIAEKSFFPFVKFKMFDSVVTVPVSTVFYVSTVDENGNESLIKKKLMYPMSNREVAGLLNLGSDAVKKSVSGILFNKANKSYNNIHKFRLYEYKCDCFKYYNLHQNMDYIDYMNTNCTKKLLLEKVYE